MKENDNFDWCEFYYFANSFSDSNKPFELRNGISRFYYAVFCICRDYLINHNLFLGSKSKNILTSESPEVHKEVVAIFFSHRDINNKYGKKIGRELSKMRKKRNKADYESKNYKFKQDYDFVKARVKIIFENLEKL